VTGPLPQPPAGAMPQGWQVAYTVFLAVPLVGLAGWCLHQWRKERDPVPLLCLAGGAVCVLFEPIVDVLGLCWYPRQGQWMLFETLGRPIPVGVLFGYMWAFGGLSAVAYRVLRDKGPGALAKLYPIFIAVSIPFELIANHTGYYVYYGHQPLRILEWPAWWGPVNFAVPVVAAVMLVRFRPLLAGPRLLVAASFLPMADGAVNGATAWPVWSALNSPGLPAVVVQAAGLASVGLAVLVVWLVTHPPVTAADPDRNLMKASRP
jgi:hypothetical protein